MVVPTDDHMQCDTGICIEGIESIVGIESAPETMTLPAWGRLLPSPTNNMIHR